MTAALPDTVISAPDPTALSRLTAPASDRAGMATTALQMMRRTLRKYIRTPQLIIFSASGSIMFLLIFRYVFGGAIAVPGVSYVDFLLPGLIASSSAFGGMGCAVGVAEDLESGLYDRLRSLPLSRAGVLLGRSFADTGILVWDAFLVTLVGVLVGYRYHGDLLGVVAIIAVTAFLGFAFTWPFIMMGLASGNAQAANGMAMLVFPLVFVSSAYVEVSTMPGWMQAFAEYQPVTMAVNAVRSISLGDAGAPLFEHSATWYAGWTIVWSIGMAAVFIPLAARMFAKK